MCTTNSTANETTSTPYVEALSIIANCLWSFDDDHMIPAYGFGDEATKNKRVFSFEEAGQPSLSDVYSMEEGTMTLLGRGKFSVVHRTVRRADGLPVALKTIQVGCMP